MSINRRCFRAYMVEATVFLPIVSTLYRTFSVLIHTCMKRTTCLMSLIDPADTAATKAAITAAFIVDMLNQYSNEQPHNYFNQQNKGPPSFKYPSNPSLASLPQIRAASRWRRNEVSQS